MDKNQWIELSERVLDRTATEEERKQWAETIETDPEASQQYSELANLHHLLNPPFDPRLIDSQTAYSEVCKRVSLSRKTPSVPFLYRAAAILLLPLLSLSAYLIYQRSHPVAAGGGEITVVAPYGTTSSLTLPDGSKVWLNAGAQLVYPSVFSTHKREVKLRGEAYFEVRSSADRPFRVQTNRLSVEATGTAFNVEDYERDSLAYVSLDNGKLDVTTPHQKSCAIAPGQRFSYNSQKRETALTDTPDSQRWSSWRKGVLILRDDPLNYLFDRLSKTYNVNFRLQDTRIANHLYRATFEEESLSEILRLLEISSSVRFTFLSRTQKPDGTFDRQTILVDTK